MDAERIRPATWWYWVGFSFIIFGLAVVAAWGLPGYWASNRQIEEFHRVDLAPNGTGDISLEPGGYVVYLEGPGAGRAGRSDDIREHQVTIASPTGAPVPLQHYKGASGYDLKGYQGRAFATIQVTTRGVHHVQTRLKDCSSCWSVAIGPGLGPGMPQANAIRVLVGLVIVLTGGIMAAVTRFRRKRPPSSWGPAPPGLAGR